MLAKQTLSLKGRALKALASREHSRAELERKLLSFESEPGQLAALLDDLQAKGFLDEQRAADMLAHRRGQKLGALRVVQEMRARGITAQAIEQASAQLKASELQRAQHVWQKRFGQPASSPAESAKQVRFLLGRGFSSDVIRSVVNGSEALDFDSND